MRNFRNLVKRINLVEIEYGKTPEKMDFDNVFLAYRMQTYLKRSYKTLCLNGIKIERVEE